MATVSLRLEDATISEIDQLASEMDRNRSWLINEAIQSFLEAQRLRAEAVAASRTAIATGKWTNHAEVRATMKRRFAKRRAK